jgi:hypothetical protein
VASLTALVTLAVLHVDPRLGALACVHGRTIGAFVPARTFRSRRRGGSWIATLSSTGIVLGLRLESPFPTSHGRQYLFWTTGLSNGGPDLAHLVVARAVRLDVRLFRDALYSSSSASSSVLVVVAPLRLQLDLHTEVFYDFLNAIELGHLAKDVFPDE